MFTCMVELITCLFKRNTGNEVFIKKENTIVYDSNNCVLFRYVFIYSIGN